VLVIHTTDCRINPKMQEKYAKRIKTEDRTGIARALSEVLESMPLQVETDRPELCDGLWRKKGTIHKEGR